MNYKGIIKRYESLAKQGSKRSIKQLMDRLNKNMSLAESKFIDYALGLISTDEGVKAMEHYLFYGTQIQRNYCTLYFARKGEYSIIRKAYDKGLIDAKQAFSR